MSNPSAFRANRAIGAMFFSVFGGIFFAVWFFRGNFESIPVLLLIILLTLCMILFALSTYNKNKAALVEEETPDKKRSDKLFHIINFGQWILILIVGNVLVNLGRPDLVIPSAILIIGAHFLPLAKIFKYYPHYITGILFILWAVLYPNLIGGANPAGCIVPGIILWSSALFGLTIKAF